MSPQAAPAVGAAAPVPFTGVDGEPCSPGRRAGGESALPEVTRVSITDRGVFLLRTDGLAKHVSDEQIAEAIRTTATSEEISRALLALALERGGTDNVTVIVGQARGAAGRGR